MAPRKPRLPIAHRTEEAEAHARRHITERRLVLTFLEAQGDAAIGAAFQALVAYEHGGLLSVPRYPSPRGTEEEVP